MRIITGTARGTKLKTPKGDNTRPTADRIKESLFNMLGYFVQEKAILDLFSGTGNLALEALSRGAKHAVMVDTSKDSFEAIKYNIERTHFTDKGQIMTRDVLLAIKILHQQGAKFDIIFCDPPYHHQWCNKVLEALSIQPLLTEDGLLIMEHGREDELPDTIGLFTRIRQQTYGATTQISIYELTSRTKAAEGDK